MRRGLFALLSSVLVACRIGYDPLPVTGAIDDDGSSGGTSTTGGTPGRGGQVAGDTARAGGSDAEGADAGAGAVASDAGGAGSGGSSDSGGTSALGGTSDSGGTSGSGSCTPSPEVCDGLDNDCSNTADDGAVCASGCEGATYAGHRYTFCTSQLTWSAAEADCSAQGLNLVRINDAGELDWVGSVAFAAAGGDNTSPVWRWLGANDLGVEGEWLWPDGTQFWQGTQTGSPIGGLYNSWGQGQPIGKDDCAMMQNTASATPLWSAMPCDLTNPYVCELY